MAGVLFLDIAPGLTGYCVGDGSTVPTADAWNFPDYGADLGAMGEHMCGWISTFAASHDLDAVGYEAPILKPHDKLMTLRRTLGLGMVVETECKRITKERGRRLRCGEVDLRRIKTMATGDQWAEKKDVAAAVDAAGIPLPKTIVLGRHDAADAAVGWVIMLSEVDAAAASPWIARFTGSLL